MSKKKFFKSNNEVTPKVEAKKVIELQWPEFAATVKGVAGEIIQAFPIYCKEKGIQIERKRSSKDWRKFLDDFLSA